MSLEDYYSKIKSLVDDIFAKTTAIVAKTKEQAIYKGIVAFFFIKGWKTYQSIYLLCSRKLAEDAEILLRSLFEMVVNLTYISKVPFKRAELFLEYDFIQRKELLEILKSTSDPWAQKILKTSNSESLKELLKEYNRVKKNYPDKWRWSGKTIKQMAKEVDLELHYASVYWLFSNLAHTNPRSMLQYIDDNEKGLVIGQEPAAKYINKILFTTCTYFLMIIDTKNRVFELGFDQKIEELKKELKAIGTSVLEDERASS